MLCLLRWEMGLEPTASRATIWRASQLRHTHHMSIYLTLPVERA